MLVQGSYGLCKELVQSELSAPRTVQFNIEIEAEMCSRSEIKVSFCSVFIYSLHLLVSHGLQFKLLMIFEFKM